MELREICYIEAHSHNMAGGKKRRCWEGHPGTWHECLPPCLPTDKGNSLARSKQGKGSHAQICSRAITLAVVSKGALERKGQIQGERLFYSVEKYLAVPV